MRRHPSRDEGSALVIAVAIVAVIGIVLGAVLTFASTTQRTTIALRNEATTSYEVDGAVQQAINTMQRGAFVNDEGAPCFDGSDTSSGGPSDTMVIPDADGTGSIAVECEGVSGSGVQSPDVPITPVNKPGNAVLTLGSTEGLYLNSSNPKFQYRFGGPVFSHGPIRTNDRSVVAREYVRARGNCPDAANITPAPQCNYSGFDGGWDPGYVPPTPVPTYRTVPSTNCSKIATTVALEPGYYDDAAALNALTGRGCTYWFKPGTYYFDFHNGDNSALPSSTHEWEVTRGVLIAGTPGGPTGCVDPLDSTTNNGVRFIFGGNSRLTVSDHADAQICGTYSATEPPIAVHSVRAGSESQSADDLRSTGQSAVAMFIGKPGDQSSLAWQGTTAADDAMTAQWIKTAGTVETGYLETTGYEPSGAVPPGSVIDSAIVRVRHSNPAAQLLDTRQVVLTIGGKSCTLLAADTASAAESLNVLTGCPSTFVQALHSSGLPAGGTKLRYNATLTRAGTEVLDQLTLDITYRAPAYRSQQNAVVGDTCVLGNAYIPDFAPGQPTGCALLDLYLDPSNRSTINGTVYSPVASVSLQMHPLSGFAFGSGVIARSLYVHMSGNLEYATFASIPYSSQGTDPSAYLTAYVCETASTCSSATGVPRVRAKVTLVGPTTARREAKIPSFSVLQ